MSIMRYLVIKNQIQPGSLSKVLLILSRSLEMRCLGALSATHVMWGPWIDSSESLDLSLLVHTMAVLAKSCSKHGGTRSNHLSHS